MFGWEFPPHMSGGLGTACFGITKALSGLGHSVIFVIPRMNAGDEPSHVELVSASKVPVPKQLFYEGILKRIDVRHVDSLLRPYMTQGQYASLLRKQYYHLPVRRRYDRGKKGYVFLDISEKYGPDLISEVLRYSKVACVIGKSHTFDVIHAHDWMTVFAAMNAKKVSGKPFVLHIHSLEFDRSGEHINRNIYDIERYGMESADRIIAVSHYTKNIITARYGISPDKISVVHNAVSRTEAVKSYHIEREPDRKIVLFLGRITFQKGPDSFVEAASLVLNELPEVTFVMAGAGDMMPRMVERVAELGIGKNVHFTGFLQGSEVERVFTMSDLYVMPSVSEPFGISPLEAMLYDVPVIISRQSGVSEILRHALKIDFWDVKEMANKMIAVLKYPELVEEMVERSREELKNIHWETAAQQIAKVYRLAGV